MKKIMLGILLVMVSASCLIAVEPPEFIDNNAALRYLLAMGYMPQLSTETADRLINLNSLEALKKLQAKNVQELTADENFVTTVFRLLDLAAECPHSAFMVDSEYDFDSIVPPYRSIRLFARFINVRGWMDAEKGNYVGAAKKFVHVFRLGVNFGNDGPAVNAMISMGIQRIAIESINNLLKLTRNAEVKKVLRDYFASLPKPVLNFKIFLNNEKRFIDNSLIKTEKAPELLAQAGFMTDEAEKKTEKTAPVEKPADDVLCAGNQRVLMGAIEMYLMDHESAPEVKDSLAFINKLVAEEYLKSAPQCPGKGSYSVNAAAEGNFIVTCSCGVTPESATTSAHASEGPEVSPEVIKKIRDYLMSHEYADDKKEIDAIFAEMLDIDPYAADAELRCGKLSDRITNSQHKLVNILIFNPGSYYRVIRENQLSIDALVDSLKK